MPVHIVYCRRDTQPEARADPTNANAVPVWRETGSDVITRAIQRDGTIAVVFDGLRLAFPLPPQAAPIVRLIDGKRSVGAIAAELASRNIGADAFARAWPAAFSTLERINRLLLSAPAT
jgi:hypothetical protein